MNGPGFNEATQLRSGALGLLKKDFMTSGPQGLIRTNEPWAAPFIRYRKLLHTSLRSSALSFAEATQTGTAIGGAYVQPDVRFWHLADIDADAEHVAFGGKADISDRLADLL